MRQSDDNMRLTSCFWYENWVFFEQRCIVLYSLPDVLTKRKAQIMTVQETINLVQRDFDTYNNHSSDPEWLYKATAVITEDCEIIDIPSGIVLRGPEGYKEFLLQWSIAFPDSRADIANLFATEDQAVVEFTVRGTHAGPLSGASGEIAPTHRKLDLGICQLFRIKDGKFVKIVTYYDAMTMMQQFGLMQ